MLLGAGYSTGSYMLARLFLGRFLSAVAALALTLSPVVLGQILTLRDFSKGPFSLWDIVLSGAGGAAGVAKARFDIGSVGGRNCRRWLWV